MTDEDADAHLSKLCRLRELYDETKAELRAEARRASPSLQDLKSIERGHFVLKLVVEKMCVDTDRSRIPAHIWEKYFRP